jgi:hypothetical protein
MPTGGGASGSIIAGELSKTGAKVLRAVRRGVANDGHRLYPAMPYPSYAKLSEADVASLYDFFMKEVLPVHQANLPNEIPLLLSFRWPLAIWNFFLPRAAGTPPKATATPIGIAAPIWCKDLAIAAPATPRVAWHGRKRRSTTAARGIQQTSIDVLGDQLRERLTAG